MQGVFLAATAVFLEFQPVRVVATILLGGVITLLAFDASEVNHLADIFLCHVVLCLLVKRRGCVRARHVLPLRYPPTVSQSRISVMTPAPTVRPPSRMANFEPFS